MSIVQAIILGIIQGLTEFIPISSSGHLVVVPHILGWKEPPLFIGVILHFGTLVAVVLYFKKDIVRITGGLIESIRKRSIKEENAKLAWAIIIATLPAVFFGLLFHEYLEALFGQPEKVGYFFAVTGLILLVGEAAGKRNRSLKDIKTKDVIGVGLAQALAVFPGISRSGATIAAGLSFGLRREDAARLSFLMSGLIILGTTIYELVVYLLGQPEQALLMSGAAGAIAAAVSGYAAIHFLLRYVRKRSLAPFAIYCWLAALATFLLT